jgi:hypothetical protein
MSTDIRSMVLTIAVIALILVGLYLIDPTFFGLLKSSEGFEATMGADSNYQQNAGLNEFPGSGQQRKTQENAHSAGGDASTTSGFMDASGAEQFQDASGAEGFANMEDVTGPAAFAAPGAPAGCYPRDQLTPGELLPKDANSVWAQQNPMGTGSLKGKNFLSAGSLLGVNTVGQSLRNANYQLRSEPPNPQTPVSVFNIPTIEPDVNRRDFDIN